MSTSISILDLANVYLNDPLNDIQFITDINFYNDDFYSVYNNNIVLGGTGRNKVVIGTSNIDTDVKLYVEGDSMFNSNVDITCNLTVEGNSFFNSNVDITCNLTVEGNGFFYSNVDITCNLTVEGNSFFNSNVDITCNLTVEGTITGLSIDGDIDANMIVSGTLSADRIPNLNASKINAGTLHSDRIPNLNASKINAGTLSADRIPSMDASKINSGTLNIGRIPVNSGITRFKRTSFNIKWTDGTGNGTDRGGGTYSACNVDQQVVSDGNCSFNASNRGFMILYVYFANPDGHEYYRYIKSASGIGICLGSYTNRHIIHGSSISLDWFHDDMRFNIYMDIPASHNGYIVDFNARSTASVTGYYEAVYSNGYS